MRLVLASTLSSVYGIYSGFELCEAAPYPGKEEYLNSEKYELKAWDYDRPGNIREHIIKLNHIRRENPALWDFRNVVFTGAYNDNIIAYAKTTPDADNCVFVMVNLDPKNRQECTYEVPLWLLGRERRRRGRGRGPARRLHVRACAASRTASPSIRSSDPASSGASAARSGLRVEAARVTRNPARPARSVALSPPSCGLTAAHRSRDDLVVRDRHPCP